MRQPVDKAAEQRAKDEKYSSGNEGRLHPGLRHPGYFQGPRPKTLRTHNGRSSSSSA